MKKSFCGSQITLISQFRLNSTKIKVFSQLLRCALAAKMRLAGRMFETPGLYHVYQTLKLRCNFKIKLHSKFYTDGRMAKLFTHTLDYLNGYCRKGRALEEQNISIIIILFRGSSITGMPHVELGVCQCMLVLNVHVTLGYTDHGITGKH